MGTPAFAVPTLSALVDAGYSVELIVTQPDRPAGRKQILKPPPVKLKALDLGLPVFQPLRVKTPDSCERLQAIAPEVIVVVGYGQIIPRNIIDLPHMVASTSMHPCSRSTAAPRLSTGRLRTVKCEPE